ncbi:hypothetical protein CBM2599_B50432 [Cupriavidus taiwanensis]|nr:hypothetical protein CBM2600_B10561 [Cupriavidus taiwanensis]SOY96500.1 hypothetical protein CBM2599_B50432 [Cupriavidus taiwanensis]
MKLFRRIDSPWDDGLAMDITL